MRRYVNILPVGETPVFKINIILLQKLFIEGIISKIYPENLAKFTRKQLRWSHFSKKWLA